MKFTGVLQVFLLFALCGLAFGVRIPDGLTLRSRRDGDITIGKMGFKGEIGGHYFELNGTIQEVVAQAQKLHPGIQHNWTAPDLSKGPHPENTYLQARQGAPVGQFCWPVPGQPWAATYHTDLTNAVIALRSFYWQICTFPAGPGTCTLLSCTANTEVHVCNDNNFEIALNCGGTPADMAQAINRNCNTNGLTGGQEFNTDNYNVYTDWRTGC
ncbi:hypothetical protein N431DRAFT_320778 [Stipitochalara longipes BDJ]|nr:hypothetical protein N431DRAFT_320778 [Stipitochalara longipes BDJ]